MSKPMFIYNPGLQFFDNSGLVANGAKLFVYLPGTTTKQNTYPTAADAAAGTNANTNPIVLNSAGRTTVDMYIGASFKLVLAPSTDTDPPAAAYWTRDNLTTLGQTVATSAKSADYTTVASDRDKLITMDASGGNKTFTVLPVATAGDGFNLKFKKIDSSANTVTIQFNAAETMDGANTYTLASQNDYLETYANGTLWYKAGSTVDTRAKVQFSQMQIFTSSGTFNVPSNVSRVYVEAWGGGGSGGGSTGSWSGGGGGAAFVCGIITVTPSGAITVTVGAGGASINANTATNGNNGTSTSFGSSLIAAPGAGPTAGVSSVGGVGAVPSSCTIPTYGYASPGAQGGGGASLTTGIPYGYGGAAGKMGVTNAFVIGQAGAANTGSGGCGGNTSTASGAGGTGLLIVYY